MNENLINFLNHLPEVKEFLRHLKIEARYSPLTIYGYQTDLLLFFRFIDDLRSDHGEPTNLQLISLSSITKSDIRNFLYFLDSDRNYSDRSLHRKICCLRSFFKFCHQEGYIEVDPTKTIKTPKIEKSIPVFMDNEEYKVFLQAAESLRDQLVLRLLLATGMRVSEVEALNITHIDQSNCTVKVVKGKGKKQRIIDIDPITIQLMKEYIENERDITTNSEDRDALFLNRQKRRLSKRTIQRIVKKCREKAGLKKKITPHKCRHTTGRLLLEGGMDIRVIQEEFGHKSLSTTEI
ncbi:MAG: tyrosine-type recombinase/integrase, partial [Candidatus Helarchaeota archaeon]|nr:tyrosine-type recombinase/integrase [Candidatus Helarchaeota archaeon]